MDFGFLKDPVWRRRTLVDAFGKGFLGFLIFALLMGVLTFFIKGPQVVHETLLGDIVLLGEMLPRVVVALSIAALVWVMLPRERITKLVGVDSGFRGLVIATLAGTVTPGGPSSAYALLAMLAVSGADRGALVAYITAWATLGLQRILVWDVPFLGPEFAILRFAVSIGLPILAGLIARRLTFTPMDCDAQREGAE